MKWKIILYLNKYNILLQTRLSIVRLFKNKLCLVCYFQIKLSVYLSAVNYAVMSQKNLNEKKMVCLHSILINKD